MHCGICGYCALRFGLSMLFNAIFKKSCLHTLQNRSLITINLYLSLPSASVGCLDLFPRIPACAHRCLFFLWLPLHFYWIIHVWWQELDKGSYSWRGLARTEREPWLSKGWHDAMRCDAKINEARIQQTEPQLNMSFLLSAHGRSFTIQYDGWTVSQAAEERDHFSLTEISSEIKITRS